MIVEDGFDLDFDLSEEDLKAIERQETQFMTQKRTPNIDTVSPMNLKLAELENHIKRLAIELESISKDKVIKEGEVALLRQKLNHFEAEKFEASKRHATKLDSMELERQSLLSHWQREIERLQTELKFKENEARMSSVKHEGQVAAIPSNAASFVSGFGDLMGTQKRPKITVPARREVSCEVDNLISPIRHVTIDENPAHGKVITLEMLFKAIGFADFTFAQEDVVDGDRQNVINRRDAVQKVATMTGNVMLAVECEFLRAVHEKKVRFDAEANFLNPMIYYMSLVLEFLVCWNRTVGVMIRSGIPDYSIGDSTLKLLKKDDFPTSSTLLAELCRYLTDLHDGVCGTIVHQHLRILKHIIYGEKVSLPECIFNLVEGGALVKKLNAFYPYRLEILVDILHLVSLMTFDSRLGKTLPASVAFEPLTLRHLSRRLACIARNSDGANLIDSQPDILAMVQIFHQIIVIEKAPPVRLLVREFITTIYFARKFSLESNFYGFLDPYLKSILPILEEELENVLAKKYLPIPLPEIKKRDVPLTEEEERAMYKSWEEQGLI